MLETTIMFSAGIIHNSIPLTMEIVRQESVFIPELFDALPESVIWFIPVWEKEHNRISEIRDFEVGYCNNAACEFLNADRSEIIGKTVLGTSLVDEAYKNILFHQCLQVWQSGKQHEENFYNHFLKKYFSVLRSKVLGGVISVSRDRTQFYQAEQEHFKHAKLLDSILDVSINAVIVLEARRNQQGLITDQVIVKVNKLFSKITGASEDQVIGESMLKYFPSAKNNGLFQTNSQVIETGLPLRTEFFYEGDGLNNWFDISMVKLGENGLVVTFADITKSRLNEIKLEQITNRLQTIINTSQVGIFTLIPVKEKEGSITDFSFGIINSAVAAYIGQKAETLIDQPASRWFPAYVENGLFDIYKKTFETGNSQHFNFHYEDGYDVYFDILATKMNNEILVTFTDHTAIKKLQLQLESSIEELKRSNSSLEEFAYAASHDLQEPLRKINYFSERLRAIYRDSLTPESMAMFERMENSTSRMRHLINDLLAYSQVSTKPRSNAEVDLNVILQQVTSDLETTIHDKKATIKADPLPVVNGDATQLRQMLQNLISNSLKYSKTDLPPIIEINSSEASHLNDHLQPFNKIEVKDNGIGFDQEHAQRIFQVFQRLHGKSEYPGTGVGLAIVHKVVTNHGGVITAESNEDEGATFTIYLPLKQ